MHPHQETQEPTPSAESTPTTLADYARANLAALKTAEAAREVAGTDAYDEAFDVCQSAYVARQRAGRDYYEEHGEGPGLALAQAALDALEG